MPGEGQSDAGRRPLAARPQGRPGDDPGAAAPDTILGVATAQALELARLGGALENLLAGHAVAQDLAGRRGVTDAGRRCAGGSRAG